MTDELLKALQTIKNECKKHNNCNGCPILTYGDECGLESDKPSKWALEKREVYF